MRVTSFSSANSDTSILQRVLEAGNDPNGDLEWRDVTSSPRKLEDSPTRNVVDAKCTDGSSIGEEGPSNPGTRKRLVWVLSSSFGGKCRRRKQKRRGFVPLATSDESKGDILVTGDPKSLSPPSQVNRSRSASRWSPLKRSLKRNKLKRSKSISREEPSCTSETQIELDIPDSQEVTPDRTSRTEESVEDFQEDLVDAVVINEELYRELLQNIANTPPSAKTSPRRRVDGTANVPCEEEGPAEISSSAARRGSSSGAAYPYDEPPEEDSTVRNTHQGIFIHVVKPLDEGAFEDDISELTFVLPRPQAATKGDDTSANWWDPSPYLHQAVEAAERVFSGLHTDVSLSDYQDRSLSASGLPLVGCMDLGLASILRQAA